VRSRGCVLTVGSTAGLTGSLTNQRSAHSASKGAVIALTRQLAAEGAPHGIRANCVSPGMVDTEGSRGDLLAADHPMCTIARHIPLGRVGLPDEVVGAAVFLASDEASYITGANLVVDGGWSSVLPG
jgi:NAD(P)-dependent dehydrogenase (short-subunit alcohol dehydrogenase family)